MNSSVKFTTEIFTETTDGVARLLKNGEAGDYIKLEFSDGYLDLKLSIAGKDMNRNVRFHTGLLHQDHVEGKEHQGASSDQHGDATAGIRSEESGSSPPIFVGSNCSSSISLASSK